MPDIIITTVQELENINNNLSGHYVLGNDINANSAASLNNGTGFAPIGTLNNPFTGVLDGQGFTINGLTINSSASYVGLFAVVGGGAQIKNISLANENITA